MFSWTETHAPSHKRIRRIALHISAAVSVLLVHATAITAENNFRIEATEQSSITNSAADLKSFQHATNNVQWFANQAKLKLNVQSGNRELFNVTEPSFGFALPNDSSCQEANGNSRDDRATCNELLPLWHDKNGLTDQGRALLELIDSLTAEGIDSAQFSDKRFSGWLENNQSDDPQLAESVLEKTFNQVAHAIGSGLVDPQIAQKEWDRKADTINPQELKRQIRSTTEDVVSVLNGVRPQHPAYQGLQNILKELQAINPAEQVFVETDNNFQIGDTDPAIAVLKKALLDTGDLGKVTYPENEFDSQLKSALISFQTRHGLEEDGVFNAKTREALNAPVTSRIQQVKANLERWRWFPAKLEDTHVLVNIPEYRLRMTHQMNQLFAMDVVVGTPRHMTPIFSEKMDHVVFAPTWTVPSSITNEELIPLETKSPGYLEREEIDIFERTSTGLRKVPRSSVDIANYADHEFPYTLRQRAGDKNALGKVKFMMPNKHAVYMHDTKAKKLFDNPQRAYSHGCIRLSNPDMMAYVIMQLEGHSQSVARENMAATSTTRVNLENKIPVHLAYFTAWQDDKGQMHFRKDIYGQDKLLIEALEKQEHGGSNSVNVASFSDE